MNIANNAKGNSANTPIGTNREIISKINEAKTLKKIIFAVSDNDFLNLLLPLQEDLISFLIKTNINR